MDLWRITAWVMALTLSHFPLHADSLQQARDFCRQQQAQAAPPCHLQPCPCNPGEITRQRFEDGDGSPPLCACSSPLTIRNHTRSQAVAACESYRQAQGQPCFISRGNCPPGFQSLGDFSDAAGNAFNACRDGRHEQPRPTVSGLHDMPQTQLLAEYDQLIEHLESLRQGPSRALPARTVADLSRHFHALAPQRLTLSATRALSRGCFSDCERVYCADTDQINRWTDPDQPLISPTLLHQMAHGERCLREGGREPFVSRWFQQLPEEVLTNLRRGDPIDAARIHFAMYMETHANHRAESLCRQLPNCRME